MFDTHYNKSQPLFWSDTCCLLTTIPLLSTLSQPRRYSSPNNAILSSTQIALQSNVSASAMYSSMSRTV